MARLFSDSDAGELFADQRGVIVWRNRRHRFTATRSTTAQWAIGNGPGRDLLSNGSLDTVTGGSLTGWTSSGTVTLSSAAVRGRHAAEMAASATLTATAAAVAAGIDYTATLAANGTGSLTLDVEWRTGGGALISTSTATLTCTGPGTWDWHQATFTAPATAETATVVVTNSAAGAVTVDEVSLQADPQNLITTNPGFEDDPFADGWTITAGSGTVTADTDGPHTGNTAALLACASGTPPVVVSPAATVTAGTVVVVAVAARSDSTTPLGVRLDFFDGGGSALHQATLETPDGTWMPGPTWSTFTASVTVPASAATAKLRLAPTTTGNM